MRKFAVENRDDWESEKIKEELIIRLQEKGWIYDSIYPDLVVCVGGDGTLLRSIHKYLNQLQYVSFVGIHTGTLGFLTDYTKGEIEQFISDLQKEPLYIEESTLLEIDLKEVNKKLYAFNEVRIESVARTVTQDVYIDQEFFEKCTGSGICISTQAGSTAVNRALQGAVIDSGLSVLQLCEIMPVFHQGHRSLRNPYIMNATRTITLTSENFSDTFICYDHLHESLDGIHEIRIRSARQKVRFARYRTYSYFCRLKTLY
jgi:NAD+ kinase